MPLIIDIKVIPSSGRYQWKLQNDILKCYLKSAPEKGRANKELIAVLSKILQICPSAITILSGATARRKRLKIDAPLSFDMLLSMLGIEKQMKLV